MLALIAIGLLVILVLVIYLADRVSSLERQTQDAVASLKERGVSSFKGPFGGLSAKKLWDAMTGLLPEGMDEQTVMDVRERYEAVIQKHIEAVFSEGVKDGERGLSGEPKNTRWVTTLRGQVESWLPQAQVNAIYKAGLDFSTAKSPDQQALVRQAFGEPCRVLYEKVGVEPLVDLVAQLVPAAPSGAVIAPTGENSPAPQLQANPVQK